MLQNPTSAREPLGSDFPSQPPTFCPFLRIPCKQFIGTCMLSCAYKSAFLVTFTGCGMCGGQHSGTIFNLCFFFFILFCYITYVLFILFHFIQDTIVVVIKCLFFLFNHDTKQRQQYERTANRFVLALLCDVLTLLGRWYSIL